MNTFYNDARVSESICIDNDTEVIVVRRSYPSGSADVAITFAYACPESGAATSLTVELSPKKRPLARSQSGTCHVRATTS